jgi:hypothetical protein
MFGNFIMNQLSNHMHGQSGSNKNLPQWQWMIWILCLDIFKQSLIFVIHLFVADSFIFNLLTWYLKAWKIIVSRTASSDECKRNTHCDVLICDTFQNAKPTNRLYKLSRIDDQAPPQESHPDSLPTRLVWILGWT